MAMSNAEKVRAFREREKKKKEANARKPQGFSLSDIFIAPFNEFFDRSVDDVFHQTFDMMDMEAPEFADDAGPKSFTGSYEEIPELKESIFPDSGRSLDRAELLVGCLLDAAVSLAQTVNDFKKREIDARIRETTAGDLTDPGKSKIAVERIVILTKMREQLDKDVRWTVPQWRVEKPGSTI